MKVLHIKVPNCGSCPFHEHVNEDLQTTSVEGDLIADFPQGWFCLHRDRRGYIMKLSDTMGQNATLSDFLELRTGRPFPMDCPLPDEVKAPDPLSEPDPALDVEA